METSSSTRRVTRSQTKAAANSNNNNIPMSKKVEEYDKSATRSRQRKAGKKQQQDRSALIDITNGSPIVGLAMGSLKTPSSAMSKRRVNGKKAKYGGTPGSGEALLRDQVKTLLQKVEEEAELSKISLENRPFLHLQGINVNSPMGLLAPTPANTPQVLNLSASGLASVSPSPIEDKLVISQMVTEIHEGKKQEAGFESQKDLVTRSLLLDFSEKSEECDSSSVVTLTHLRGEGESEESKEKMIPNDDDDNASIWSIQVNASSPRDDEEDDDEEGLEGVEEEGNDKFVYEEEEGEEEEEEDDGVADKLCEGFSKMNVNGGRTMAKFSGKHTRFLHNSDDEVVEGQEECVDESEFSSSVLHLKGLPTPKGKHIRFHDESDQD